MPQGFLPSDVCQEQRRRRRKRMLGSRGRVGSFANGDKNNAGEEENGCSGHEEESDGAQYTPKGLHQRRTLWWTFSIVVALTSDAFEHYGVRHPFRSGANGKPRAKDIQLDYSEDQVSETTSSVTRCHCYEIQLGALTTSKSLRVTWINRLYAKVGNI